MDINRQRPRILRNFASLPGCRDRNGGPVVVISPQPGISNGSLPSKAASTSDLYGAPFPYEDLVSVLGYFSEIPDAEALNRGFTVLVDARKTQPKTLKTVLRACQQALYRKVRQAIIVQPEKFLDQQKINFDLMVEAYEFKTILTSVHKLSKHIDITQVTESFGGTFHYDPLQWCEKRDHYEAVMCELQGRVADLENSNSKTEPLTEEDGALMNGEKFISEMGTGGATVDDRTSATRVRNVINRVKATAQQPELEAQVQKRIEEDREKTKMLEDHAEGVTRMLDWLEGPGEKWLLSLHEIGESRDEAKQLLEGHEQIIHKSKEVTEQAEELAELATRLTATAPEHAITLEKARDHLRSLTTQFSSRVHRSAEMVERSEKFHQMMSEFSRKTDSLLESLCTDIKSSDLQGVEGEKSVLEKKVTSMEKIYEEVMDMGALFVEDLSSVERTPIGNKVTRDYSAGVVHIREQMAASRERRKRCLELVDVRRLKLQQIIQLFTCENDAQQAIKWIEELHETLLKDYNQVGCDEEDLHLLREDRMKLEETARSTYEYGKQLCQVALVLRRSLRLDGHNQKQISDKLEHTWGRLCRALSENEARLNVTEAFHSTCVEINRRIEELDRRVKEHLLVKGRSSGHSSVWGVERRRLSGDIRELRHIGDMLAAQTNANHNASVEARQVAIAQIRKKIDDVEEKQRRLDSLFEEREESEKEPTYVRDASDGVRSIRLSETESYL